MKTLQTEIVVDAPPDQVWRVLVDFGRYEEWNPFVVELRGIAASGARLRARMSPPGGRRVTLRPRITELQPGVVLEWLGHVMVPGLFDGRHRFQLERRGTGTLVRQHEDFTGILVPLMAKSIDGPTRMGLEAMNDALKARVESLVAETSG